MGEDTRLAYFMGKYIGKPKFDGEITYFIENKKLI